MFVSVEYTCLNVLLLRHRFDMVMALLGYWRISSENGQDESRQVSSLKEAGCDKIYGDKITGSSNYGDRPELSKCLDALREGDTWVIHELDRAGRNIQLIFSWKRKKRYGHSAQVHYLRWQFHEG